MRATLGLISAAVIATCMAVSAGADDAIPTIQIPDQYLVSKGPAGLPAPPPRVPVAKAAAAKEAAQAVNGTLYAVIAPTFTGATTSFIRFFNGGSFAATFSVTIVTTPSGTTVGTANIQVPVRASLQRTLSELLTAANAIGAPAADNGYSLYIQSAEVTAGYQHVSFNANGFFENNSTCATLLNQAVSSVVNSAVLINLHTSRLANNTYPSQVEIHNYWNAPVTYRLTVIDAATGVIVGQTNMITAANASYLIPFTTIESMIGWTPSASQVHANLVVTDPTGVQPYVVLGQSIVNTVLTANINMSTVCAVNPVASTGGGFGGGGGGISY